MATFVSSSLLILFILVVSEIWGGGRVQSLALGRCRICASIVKSSEFPFH